MDVLSNDPEATAQSSASYRIRWGNVLLALGALAAIVAALAMPRGAPPVDEPLTERLIVTAPVSAETAAPDPPMKPRKPRRRAQKRRPRAAKSPARSAPIRASAPVAAAPAPTQLPSIPAADREFGP